MQFRQDETGFVVRIAQTEPILAAKVNYVRVV
jgi:hypothetical protein